MMFDKRFDFSVYLHIELRNFEIKCTCGVIKSFIFFNKRRDKRKILSENIYNRLIDLLC